MKKVFVAGSRKFYKEVAEVVKKLREMGVVGLTPLKPKEADDFETEKQALMKAFEMIDEAEMVYVVAVGGYVGKAVAMEMAYAYARGKKVVTSEVVGEMSARAVVSTTALVDELVDKWIA